MQNYDNLTCCDKHTNAFLDLNGMPYLLAEYLDSREFRQIDRSFIRSEINVDQSDAMRAVVDINIDDIGKRGGTNLPAIIGNNSKQKNLLKMIAANTELLDHRLDVVRRGIIIRVNYQLENQTTHQVLRSMVEDLRIANRSYYLDINPRDIEDNAVVVNFASTMVSTINQFTHGTDRMIIRITNVQMFYEGVRREHKRTPDADHTMICDNPNHLNQYDEKMDRYQYHSDMQNRHMIGMPNSCDCGNYGNEPVSMISPPGWSMFNRFYRFDNSGKDVVIHFQEVDDPLTRVFLLPCGTVQVNRAFIINPGHRIVFKLSIWKNDMTVVNDTTMIARTLKVPVYDDPSNGHHPCPPPYPYPPYPSYPPYPPQPPCPPPCPPGPPPINPDYEVIMRMLEQGRITDARQNMALCELTKAIQDLEEAIHPPVDPPTPPVDPDPPVEPDPDDDCPCLDNGIDGGTF